MTPRATRRVVCAAALGCALFVGVFVPAGAGASVLIGSFSASPSTTQAGGHPDIAVRFGLSTREVDPTACSCNDPKDVDVHLPPGLIGNPHATPQCSLAAFAAEQCPIDSQIGVVDASVSITGGVGTGFGIDFVAPVFNLIPPPSDAALLGFKSSLINTPTFEVVSSRTSTDYGLDFATDSIEHIFPLDGFEQFTWGVPAAPVHDYLRFGLGQPPTTYGSGQGGPQEPTFCDRNGEPSTADPTSVFQLCPRASETAHPAGAAPHGPGGPVASQSPEAPFLQAPTTCGSSLSTSIDVLSYDGEETHSEGAWPATTDCAQLSFNPSQAIEPTTTASDSPSGAEAHLTVPQFESPSVPSPSELRAATITLPNGFSLAPNVTNGKVTCSEAEAKMGEYGSTEEGHCPEDSKIGSLSVETPVLPAPLPGAAYLGESKLGQRFRIFLLFDGFGVHIKLAGVVTPDPVTGQIKLEFQNLPQAPFADFNLHIFGSERGPLDTPTHCGTYEVTSEWVPWDSALPDQSSVQFFTIDQGPNGSPCPGPKRPFSPGFQAASAASTAAANTSFSLNITRDDGDQNLSGLTVKTPPGFTASIKGIPYCPQSTIDQISNPLYSGAAELTAPLCAASQVGTVDAGVGAGTHPLFLPGKVYLAGPYKGAPLSLLAVIPAVSGQYDLGNVAVRAAVSIDPTTAQITTATDPLPQIIEGIPIRLRQILINLDRPGFTRNPTNCEPFSVQATLTGDQGAVANQTSHFQVASCASLPYGPKLQLRLSGGLNRLGHPAIHAKLSAAPGEANTSAVTVTLPRGELLDQSHIGGVCSRVEFAEAACPAGSRIGLASATTPLLDQPLTGNVYLLSSSEGLPDLAVDLHGTVHIELIGKVDSVNERYRTRFQSIPDAPLSSFSLDLLGGQKGLLQNSAGLCGTDKRAKIEMIGQNGKHRTNTSKLLFACGGKSKHKLHHHRSGGSR